jgi:hypothetical protein
MGAIRLAVPQTTPAQVGDFPPSSNSVFVLNSGLVDIIVNNVMVSLNPQSGCRLIPGEGLEFHRAPGQPMAIFAVSAFPNAQLQAVLDPDFDGVATFGG